MSIENFMKALTETLEKKSSPKILKTMPMRKEWTALRNECDELAEKGLAIVEKLKVKRELLWATIENETELYGKRMEIKKDGSELVVFDEEKDEDREPEE